jgi:hypothetical protein
MTTSYVDVNAFNSRIEKDTNNIFTYQLPNSIELPTGTEISVQNALINLQGITGASIEIEEEIEETILFQYYMSDSTYQTPNETINNELSKITRFNIYSDIDHHFNGTSQFEFNGGSAYPHVDGNDRVIDVIYGFSENIVPAVCPALWNGTEQSTIPMCGEADIRIPKGVYSISKLASIISDQINLVTNPNNQNNQTIERKLQGNYTGLFYNQTTTRGVKIEQNNQWDVYHQSGNPTYPLTSTANLRPFKSTDIEAISMVCITGSFNEEIRQSISSGMWGHDQPSGEIIDNFFPQTAPDNQRKYSVVFDQTNANDGTYDDVIYDIYSQNTMGIGTSSFNLGFSTEESAFTIQNLHEPRRLPTHDRYGNVVKNSGQSCVYTKRPNKFSFTEFNQGQTSTLNSFVQRYSGVSVYNWAWRTCKKLGLNWATKMINNNSIATTPAGTTQEQVDQYIENASKFARFDEFFSNEKAANEAWRTTIWARLGFKYTDIQAPSSFTKQKFFDQSVETINGFTTRQETDSSAIPYISTLFNGAQGGVGSTTAPKPVGEQIEPLPQSIASIQLFNLTDINCPRSDFNNNKKTQPAAVVAPYQASFYTSAVMIPIQTKGKDVSATGLPILSRNGYLYILSDIVDPDDIVKFKDNVGLLDQLPKSNLSNQDFISDRTAITHVLSAPKIVNQIRIMILNPDLTDVDLQRSSSVLLRITRPQQKQTILASNVIQNIEDNETSAAIGKAEEIKVKNLEKEKKALGIELDPEPLPPTTASDIAVATEIAVQTDEVQQVRQMAKESRTIGFQAATHGTGGAFTRRGRPQTSERARVTADQPREGDKVITASEAGLRRLREESRRGESSSGAEDATPRGVISTQAGSGRARGRARGRPTTAKGRGRGAGGRRPPSPPAPPPAPPSGGGSKED